MDYPSRNGFIEGKKIFWPNCIQNCEGPLVTNTL